MTVSFHLARRLPRPAQGVLCLKRYVRGRLSLRGARSSSLTTGARAAARHAVLPVLAASTGSTASIAAILAVLSTLRSLRSSMPTTLAALGSTPRSTAPTAPLRLRVLRGQSTLPVATTRPRSSARAAPTGPGQVGYLHQWLLRCLTYSCALWWLIWLGCDHVSLTY
jgi:hypothetical protein